jgi:hypothetical protein
MKKLATFAALFALSACATPSPEARVRASLLNAGLSRPMADCMAQRLVDRLSIQELRKLGSLAKLQHKDLGAMSIDELLHRIRALDDPHILKVVTKAGIGCAIAT